MAGLVKPWTCVYWVKQPLSSQTESALVKPLLSLSPVKFCPLWCNSALSVCTGHSDITHIDIVYCLATQKRLERCAVIYINTLLTSDQQNKKEYEITWGGGGGELPTQKKLEKELN